METTTLEEKFLRDFINSPLNLSGFGSGAYSISDCIGGVVKCEASILANRNSGNIQCLHLVDKDDQKPALDIHIFNQLPTGTYTDNAALTINTADKANHVGVISVEVSMWATQNGVSYISGGGINKFIRSSSNAKGVFYIVVSTRTAVTYTSASGLILYLGIE